MARILVVDDDPDILKIAEAILANEGHIVFTAQDAVRAMDLLNMMEFDLLLSDANMPLYSGFELISTIRRNPRYKDMAVAMLTGLRDRKDVERAVTAGVDDYIVKPLDPMILLQKINSLFEKRPPAKYPEINLTGTALSEGRLHRPVVVEFVSELGVQIVTEFDVKPGMVLDIDAEFFRTLEVAAPPMKVLRVEPIDGKFRAQLIFLGAPESLLQKIRRWLYNHGTSARVA